VKAAWQFVIHTFGWKGLIFLMGCSAFIVATAHTRHTLHDWAYGFGVTALVTLYIILDRRQELRRKRELDDALAIVNRLEASGQELYDASRQELETIRTALEQ